MLYLTSLLLSWRNTFLDLFMSRISRCDSEISYFLYLEIRVSFDLKSQNSTKETRDLLFHSMKQI